jgi:hypothetical protein
VTGSGTATGEVVLWTAVLGGLVLLAWWGMLRGWRRRGDRHDLPPLPAPTAVGAEAAPLLVAEGRYFGTTVAGAWLDRVVARGLGDRSAARLVLTRAGLDVHRPRDSFHVPAAAVEGARTDLGVAGKVVPPHGLLVLTWRHGHHLLDSGFRLADSNAHEQWVAALTRLTKEQPA